MHTAYSTIFPFPFIYPIKFTKHNMQQTGDAHLFVLIFQMAIKIRQQDSFTASLQNTILILL
jgi:hypothetical protein